MDNQVQTTIKMSGGLETFDQPKSMKTSFLNPDQPFPSRKGLRYELSHLTLGKLEKLARTKFYIRELSETDIEKWADNEISRENLAQSVNASSEIEGEGIALEQLNIEIAAVTEPTDEKDINQELAVRQRAITSIYHAALWALSKEWPQFITYDFVLELHERMFTSTKIGIAGKLKETSIIIAGGGYDITTLPHHKSEEFLKQLCERTNRSLIEARDRSTSSMFLTVAEFVSDFLAIHPFQDGNGRTSRILSTYLLEKCGYHFARFYPLDLIILETRKRYYESLFETQKSWYLKDEDMSMWIDYYVDVVYVQWTRAYQKAQDQYDRGKLRS